MKRVRQRKLKMKGFIFEGSSYRHILKKDRIDSAINGLPIVERNMQESDSQKMNLGIKQKKKIERFLDDVSARGKEKQKGKSLPLTFVRYR
ncbi:hypothetical protein AW19_4136 (plasmid) [Yersinia frederiksenii Y225]|nr:hypothetical protein AW19_4136 [Yersinia frederiksenii Y225]